MHKDEIEKHLTDIAVMLAQRDGLQFNNQKEAQAHVSSVSFRLHQMLKESSAMFTEGLTCLAESNQRPASDVARQILEQLDSPAEMNKIIDTHIIKNDQSLQQFSEAVNSFYGCGDFHVEECVIAVLLTLFPMEPQPFACYGTLIWRKDGISAAEEFYRNIVDLFESPILDYFAADCYFKAGNKDDAKILLDRALIKAQQSPEIYADIAQFIRILLNQF